MFGEDLNDRALAFDFSEHGEKARTQKLAALPIGNVAPDDHVGGAGFVFQRNEDDAACGSGPLPADDDAGSTHETAMRRGVDVRCRAKTLPFQLLTQQRERMATQREAEGAVI